MGDDHGPRSGVWRVWSQGDETYVAPRGARERASLHSGTSFYHGDRPYFSWPRPRADFGPEATAIYRIWIPSEGLTTPEYEPPDEEKAKIVLLDPAPADSQTLVMILQTGAHVVLRPPDDLPSALLAKWSLRSGEQIWVAAGHIAYPPEDKLMVDEGKSKTQTYIDAGMAEAVNAAGHPRMILFVREADGQVRRGRHEPIAT